MAVYYSLALCKKWKKSIYLFTWLGISPSNFMRTQFPKGLFLRYHTFWKRYNYGNGPDMGIKWDRSKEVCIIFNTSVKMKIALICLFVVVGQYLVSACPDCKCFPLKYCPKIGDCKECCEDRHCPRGQVCRCVILKLPLLVLWKWLQFFRNYQCVSPVDKCFPLKYCPKVGCKECCGNRDCPKGQVCRYVIF